MTRLGQTRSPTNVEVIRAGIAAQLFELHVALPASIEKYDAAKQKIDAKPLLKRNVVLSDGSELLEELPIITDVPVQFPRGGGFFTSLPLAVGDHVLLIFNERSIDKFTQGDGSDTDPTDVRMHDLSDAVAIPGFYPFSKSLADAHTGNMVLGKDGGAQIHIKPGGEIHIFEEFAAQFVALAQKVLDELDVAKSDRDAMRSTFGSHIHITTATISASAAPGTIAPPSTPMDPQTAPSSVAASNVKAT